MERGSVTLLIAVGLAICVTAAGLGFVPISLNALSAADLGEKFLTLIFVALVVERSVEVYVSNKYIAQEMSGRREVRLAEKHLDLEEKSLTALKEAAALATANPATAQDFMDKAEVQAQQVTQARVRLDTARRTAQPALEKVRVKKTTEAVSVSLLLSAGASLVGVRVLGNLFPEDFIILDRAHEADSVIRLVSAADTFTIGYWQYQVLTAYDVFITTLLLAGGAEGIHNLLKNFLGKRKDILPDG